MLIRLGERTAETVRIYFEKAGLPEIRETLPQKARTVEEALRDYEKTLLPDASSFGRTIYADGLYVGDVWCYCIDLDEEPNCMLSYCIFDKRYWSRGVASSAVELFIGEVKNKYGIRTVGAFTYADHLASIRVLEKNGFEMKETFEEEGGSSLYFQKEINEEEHWACTF